MLLDCKQCGAPLDVAEGTWIATCAYCRHTQSVRKSIHKRAEDWRRTPSNWQAPPQWTPPPQAPQRSVPLTYDPARARKKTSLVGALALMGLVAGLGGVGAAVYVFLGAAGPARSETGAPPGPQSWDGQRTLVCDGPTTLEGRQVKARATPAIALRSGCSLTLDNSTIEADLLFEGDGAVTISNSQITVKRGLSMSSHPLRARGSTLTFDLAPGEGRLLSTSGNGEIEITNTTLVVGGAGSGELVVAHCAGNGCASFRGSTIRVESRREPVVLFDTRGNGTATLDNSTVNNAGRPLTLRTVRPATIRNAELSGSELVGGER